MKRKSQLTIVGIILFLIIPYTVNAYHVDVWPPKVQIQSVYGTHVIQYNDDLKSNVWMIFYTPQNFTDGKKNITISFGPSEWMTNKPIKDISFEVCDKPDGYGWNYDTGYSGPCNISYNYSITQNLRERNFIYQGEIYPENYSTYQLIFTPKESNQWDGFVFRVKYTTPHFISKQGDYSVAWLNYPGMENKDFSIENYLVLPTKDDIPRFIPEAKKISKAPYFINGNIFYRWVFVFEGTDDKIVWYWNDKSIKKNEIKLQEKYMYMGAIIGALIGLITAIILLFFEKIFFDWLPYGNNINRWIASRLNPAHVIGNIIKKKYHRTDCAYVDNIIERNQRPFKSKKEAEREGFTPCNLCNPDK